MALVPITQMIPSDALISTRHPKWEGNPMHTWLGSLGLYWISSGHAIRPSNGWWQVTRRLLPAKANKNILIKKIEQEHKSEDYKSLVLIKEAKFKNVDITKLNLLFRGVAKKLKCLSKETEKNRHSNWSPLQIQQKQKHLTVIAKMIPNDSGWKYQNESLIWNLNSEFNSHGISLVM